MRLGAVECAADREEVKWAENPGPDETAEQGNRSSPRVPGAHGMDHHTQWMNTRDGWPHGMDRHTQWIDTRDGWPRGMNNDTVG